MEKLDASYWTKRYENEQTGWDTSGITTPLKEYFDQLTDKSLQILVPGAGNAYEAGYLWENGFQNVHVLDWAKPPLERFARQYPDFPDSQLLTADFFELNGQFDLIVEQTFFCAFERNRREEYVSKAYDLLAEGGKLVGLLWDGDFQGGPPFGGSRDEYNRLFANHFDIEIMELAYNSIKPRAGREVFIKMIRKSAAG